jgi:DnaB-like helicase N terminal domain/AAA domain/Helix-turn-helix domain of resolvase
MSSPALARPLPQSIDAERAILGAVLLSGGPPNKALDVASDKLFPSDFFHDHHKKIFHAMLEMREAGRLIDLVMLTDHLANSRNLEAAGGAAYLQTLMDGVPRLVNIGEYINLVHEKAQLRKIILQAGAMQTRALEGLAKPDDIYSDFQGFLKANGNGHKRRLTPIEGQELLTMNSEPLEYIIDPILPTQGLGMLYAWRGCGKTYFMLNVCYTICTGQETCFLWKIPRARRVVYVDGELPLNALQARWQKIVGGYGLVPPPKGMITFTNRTVDKQAPNIATSEGQRMIEDLLEEGTFLVLDNLSALCRTPKEDEEGWASTQEWLIDLRHRGISTLFLHHGGKSGTQRGTSKREDFLDTILKLSHPTDYSPDQLLRCEVHTEKYRGGEAEAVVPFEVRLETDPRGNAIFSYKPLRDIIERRVPEMLEMGMKVPEIAEELHISRYQVYRLKRKNSLP